MKAILIVAVLAACGKNDKPAPATKTAPGAQKVSNQSAKEAMELLCNGRERSKAPSNAELGLWVAENVHNEEVLALVHSIGNLDQEADDKAVAKMAAKYGVSPCPLVGAPPL